MDEALATWLQFGICALVIAFAGTRLSLYGDMIADKTGWSGNWVGLLLLSTVTSLPELTTGVSSVSLADAPNIAVGDVLGSCMFNLAILVLLDLLYRKESLYRRAGRGHILSAGFGIVMIALTGIGLLLGHKTNALAIGHVGIFTPVSVLLYLVAVRTVFSYETSTLQALTEKVSDRYPQLSLRQAAWRYAIAAVVVVVAGIALPFVASRLAQLMHWHTSFVGTLFVAIATSMPELAVSLAALRLGAFDMAFANLLGSNLFNILILGIDDLLFRQGPILALVSPIHAITAFSAVLMSGIVVIGLTYPPIGRPLRIMSWISLALFAVFFINSCILYRYAD